MRTPKEGEKAIKAKVDGSFKWAMGDGEGEMDIPPTNECYPCLKSGKRKYGEPCPGDSKVPGCPMVKG